MENSPREQKSRSHHPIFVASTQCSLDRLKPWTWPRKAILIRNLKGLLQALLSNAQLYNNQTPLIRLNLASQLCLTALPPHRLIKTLFTRTRCLRQSQALWNQIIKLKTKKVLVVARVGGNIWMQWSSVNIDAWQWRSRKNLSVFIVRSTMGQKLPPSTTCETSTVKGPSRRLSNDQARALSMLLRNESHLMRKSRAWWLQSWIQPRFKPVLTFKKRQNSFPRPLKPARSPMLTLLLRLYALQTIMSRCEWNLAKTDWSRIVSEASSM